MRKCRQTQEELGDLFGHCRDERQAKDDRPFPQAHEMGVEDRLQERHGANQQEQRNRKPDRVLHIAFREHADAEERRPFRADSISAEQFTQ